MIRQRFTFTGAGEDFGPRADGLVTAHTTESPYNKLTVADAIVLARWQDRADVAGSYGDLICIDGIVECVPPSHASGGINPASAFFKPEPWLYDLMSREMVHNPNYFTRNISFMGSAAWFDANGWPPQMIDHFVTVMLEEEARIGSRTILTDHGDFQTNRSDAGPIANALIRKRYAERTAQEDDMYDWIAGLKPALFRGTVIAGVPIRTAPISSDTSFAFSMPTTGRTITFIGEVADAGGGSIPYLVYVLGAGGVRCTRADNIEPGSRVDLATPTTIEVVKEVIKEVPTGITQAQLTAASAAATTAERERIALVEANRIRNS